MKFIDRSTSKGLLVALLCGATAAQGQPVNPAGPGQPVNPAGPGQPVYPAGPGRAALPATAPGAAPPAVDAPPNGYMEVVRPARVRPHTDAANKAIPTNRPYEPVRRVDDEGQIAEIEMFVGESRVFPAPGLSRIAVGNGALLTASAIDNKDVILFANGAGTSSLFIWNADGRYQRVKVSIVAGDTSRVARDIAAFLSRIPKARTSIVGTNIIVEGDELSDADLSKIDDLTKRYPQIVNFTNRVGWEQMVLMDVKVVEFPISFLREAGLKWNSTGGAAIGAIWGPTRVGKDGPFAVNIQTPSTGVAPPITDGNGGTLVRVPNALNILSVVNLGLNAQLNLLEQEGKSTTLAEPQLSARNGAKASFTAGGEIPYAVQTRDGLSVAFKEYGVKLDITPKVDQGGVIRATIHAEVSSIDASVTTAVGPALLLRKTDTEFNLRQGETMVLAGLLQREASSTIDKIPLLGDIPVLGALFRSKRYQNKETEMVVFVTPTVVTANSAGNVDRIGHTTERLEERFGPPPYLSVPLQPGVRYERPNDAAPERPSRGSGALIPSPAEPAPIGDRTGAAPAPAGSASIGAASRGAASVSSALQFDLPEREPLRFTVGQTGSALHATPDPDADIVVRLAAGDGLVALPYPTRGAWTAVQAGDGKTARRGWIASRLLVAVNP